jgi:hypothetical protein
MRVKAAAGTKRSGPSVHMNVESECSVDVGSHEGTSRDELFWIHLYT